MSWINLLFCLYLNVHKIIAMHSVFWDERFFELGVHKWMSISSFWWWLKSSWMCWINLLLSFDLNIHEVVSMNSVFRNERFLELCIDKWMSVVCLWWWFKTCWMSWVNFLFGFYLDVHKIIAMHSVFWDERFLELSVHKWMSVSSFWWWFKSSWMCWINLRKSFIFNNNISFFFFFNFWLLFVIFWFFFRFWSLFMFLF